ncbi:hypothetical protein ASE74_18050 [Pedobacter sp. Leaf216]|uniref:hypothetical protein n=1 Tax=Pedobacter sp. Leaf216 TaxID=1735684 RepID=UPI0006FB22D8|nr:hypothetical protein [Pedobacter sp. Leaf216]KQM77161.1 hypothetical protein ASE74_18050 [Pedobacter sp. Leaf216]
MKTLKLMLSVLMLMAIFTACKKDKNDPNDPNNPENAQKVSKTDLLPYYIVAERKTGDQKLAIMTFTQDGDGVKGNLHRQGYLRSAAVDVVNNTLTFDVDGTGTFVYSFVLEKNASGQVTLKSYQYTDKGNAAQGFEYAVLANTSTSQNFENADFKSGSLLFRFTGNKTIDWDIKERQIGTKYYPPPINQTLPITAVAPEVSIPYYSLTNGSFKANNDFIGAVVPSWKNTNTSTLVIERNNIIYQASKQ